MSKIDRILKIITENVKNSAETVSLSTKINTLNVDSMGLIEVIMAIESEFDVDISDSIFDDASTVEHVYHEILSQEMSYF